MPQKTLGYTELEWTCKRCGTKNPGLQKTCSNCGGPMSAEDQFALPEEQKLITDEQKLAQAQKGPDIHCPYCGARNPAGSEACVQCGGNLKTGASREVGRVLGARQEGPAAEITCPFCSAKIKPGLPRCPNCGGDLGPKPASEVIAAAPAKQKLPLWLVILGAALLLACLGAVVSLAILSGRTKDLRAQVSAVNWQRSIAILELGEVRKSSWQDDLPSDAQDRVCSEKYRGNSLEPAPMSTEVCGTPYTVDTGSGAGKVVQDCEYQVYDTFCEYTVQEWQVVSHASTQGNDLQPYWPDLNLTASQREGERFEQYQVWFVGDGKEYEYDVSDPVEYALYTVGTEWTLKVNGFGVITEVAP